MAEDEFTEEKLSVSDRLAAEALIVDVDGFEGPLDALLMLSRTQKVDLRKISVLDLARQYLAFVDRAKQLIEEGGRRAAAYKYLLENQNKMLTTILIGNNIVNIFDTH